MQFPELVLVIVVIGRPQDRAAHAALGDKSVSSLGRVGGRAFNLVKRPEMMFKDVGDGFVLRKPGRIVQRAHEKGLGGGAIRLFPDAEANGVPLRLLQDQIGDLKKRTGAAHHLNLAGKVFNALFIG